jgi:hypothetical protein
MSIINTDRITKNLQSSNGASSAIPLPTNSNKVSSVTSKLYLGPGYTKVPGITNIVYAPYELYSEIKAAHQAFKIRDGEGFIENSLRIIEAPFSFSNALLQLSWYGIYFFNSPALQNTLQTTSLLTSSIAAAGFVLCAIETVLETIGLIRTVNFLKTNSLSDHAYLTHMKKHELAHRVHPWLADRIEETLPQIQQGLQSQDPSKRAEAKETTAAILKNVKIQSQKKLLIHVIGLLAALITIAGLIAGCGACPFIIPFVILVVGGVLSLVRYYLQCGLMDVEGWNFSVANCIPEIVKKAFAEKKHTRAEPTPVPIVHYRFPIRSYCYTTPRYKPGILLTPKPSKFDLRIATLKPRPGFWRGPNSQFLG